MSITINGNGTVTGISVGGLPDGIVDTDTLAANAVTVAKAAGSVKGIQEVDQWRISATQAIAAGGEDLDTSWERNDYNFEQIGTGMTQSSGIFTFPSTGKWHVDFRSFMQDADKSRYAGCIIYFTSNNSSYAQAASAYDSIFDSSSDNVYGYSTAIAILDITNTSNCKVKFWVGAESAADCIGSDDRMSTGVTFMRLGDT
tara:strand:- start:576 stop:1175 length:600 start_codon:yes stop_codon:yes gene_type:complete